MKAGSRGGLIPPSAFSFYLPDPIIFSCRFAFEFGVRQGHQGLKLPYSYKLILYPRENLDIGYRLPCKFYKMRLVVLGDVCLYVEIANDLYYYL